MDAYTRSRTFGDRLFVAATLLVGVAACITSIALLASTSEHLLEKRQLPTTSHIYLPGLAMGNVTVNLDTLLDAKTSHVYYVQQDFHPLNMRNIKGNCLPSGLREDFCMSYGHIDEDAALFSAVPSCWGRGLTHEDFLGVCRIDNFAVIDYCITVADVDWRICRQQNRTCTTEAQLRSQEVTQAELVRFVNVSSGLVSFDVPIIVDLPMVSVGDTVELHINTGIFLADEETHRQPTVSLSIDSLHNDSIIPIRSDTITHRLLFNGEHVFGLFSILNTSVLINLAVVDTNSNTTTVSIQGIDLYIQGVPINSRLRVISVSTSLCYSDSTQRSGRTLENATTCTNAPLKVLSPNPAFEFQDITSLLVYYPASQASYNNWLTIAPDSHVMFTFSMNGCDGISSQFSMQAVNESSGICRSNFTLFSGLYSIVLPAANLGIGSEEEELLNDDVQEVPVFRLVGSTWDINNFGSGFECEIIISAREIPSTQCVPGSFVPKEYALPCSR